MRERSRKQLPAEVRQHLGVLEDVAWRLAAGRPPADGLVDDADRAYEQTIRAAIDAGSSKRQRLAPGHVGRVLGWNQVIAENARRLREQAGWTQAALAEAMSKAGFRWTRVTVAEVEGAVRRIALEELLVLAALFAEPMVTLFLPQDADVIRLANADHDGGGEPEPTGNEMVDQMAKVLHESAKLRVIDRDTLLGVLLGHSGRIGELSPASAEPAQVAGIPSPGSRTDRRPAKDLHARREQGYTQ
jgi:transcriptional regulator with XRE-family HTH domain